MGSRFVARLPSSAAWYDLWHTHVDWRSEANNDPTARRESLQSLFAAWEQVQQIGTGVSTPWQSWLVLDTEDSGQDAVYLHTPNPNRDNFPYSFEGVAWDVTPPHWLEEFVAEGGMQVGRSDYNGVTLFWVRRKGAAGYA